MLTRKTYTNTPQAEAAIRTGKKDLRAYLLAPAGEVEEGALRPAVRRSWALAITQAQRTPVTTVAAIGVVGKSRLINPSENLNCMVVSFSAAEGLAEKLADIAERTIATIGSTREAERAEGGRPVKGSKLLPLPKGSPAWPLICAAK